MHKFYFPILLSALILFGCAVPKPVALKGAYSTPVIIQSDKSFDQVWDRLIDLFAQKGLSIKVIDRSSGLIVSERSILSSTTENNAGAPKDSTAFAVSEKIYDRYTKKYRPIYNTLTGEWNVRIKKSGDKTLINVNVVNIMGRSLTISNYDKDEHCSSCRSTGVFERFIAEMIR